MASRSLARPILASVPSCSTSMSSRSLVTAASRTVSRPLASTAARIPMLKVRFKSKKSFATHIEDPGQMDTDADADVPVMRTKGKGGKAAKQSGKGATKSKRGNAEQATAEDDANYKSSTKNEELPEENYDEEALKANMTRAVERCRQTVTQMVGMHGRADPALLDSVKVSYPGGEDKTPYPLREFATVGTRDGALLVTLYDKDMLKHVERAIYLAELGLTPQQAGSGDEAVLRIPIPRPTADSRTKLLADINRICENARVSIRSARHSAQKQIKKDVDGKVVGKSEGDKEMKKMDEEAKSRQKEVEDLNASMKKKLESED